ncbi:MAG: hypothetical protein PWP10_3286 [Clostridiales bacterium]|jgi:uncharacterized membrane protein YesL|nr:hypothetical protein [Clostridiales bacterium]
MAGFFGLFNYNKEGKGVNPEDLDRGPMPTFFGVVGRKFWKLIMINLMYVLFSLPAVVIAFFCSSYFIQALFPNYQMALSSAAETLTDNADALVLQAMEMTLLMVLFGALMIGLSMIIAGPVHAGIVYVLRNYAREEHAFIWSDFKDNAISNFKQSMVSSLISLAVTAIFIVNLYFYRQTEMIQQEMLRTILVTVIVLMYVIWCIMQMYLYPMMVTFKLTLKQMYRNSFYFAILKLPMNLLFLLLSVVIMLIVPAAMLFTNTGIAFIIAIFWYVFIAFAFNLLMTTFFAYRGLDKYMLSKLAEDDNDDVDNLQDEVLSIDDKNE